MSIVTNADALAEIQHLKATSTGRLRGRPASATRCDPVDRFLRDTPNRGAAGLGWTTALTAAGIPIGYLDLAKINRCWFADESALSASRRAAESPCSAAESVNPPLKGVRHVHANRRGQRPVPAGSRPRRRGTLPAFPVPRRPAQHRRSELIEEAGNASVIAALLTERFGEVTTTESPMYPVVDADVIDALTYLDVWRSAGDSLDWDVAVIVYDVPADVDVSGVRVPAGLYAREVTSDVVDGASATASP